MKYLKLACNNPSHHATTISRISAVSLAIISTITANSAFAGNSGLANSSEIASSVINLNKFVETKLHQAAWAKGRILVQTKAGVASSQFEDSFGRHGIKSARALRQQIFNIRGAQTTSGVQLVSVSEDSELAALESLRNDPNIAFAELDRLVPLAQSDANDTYFSSGWHLPKMKVTQTWDLSKGDNVVVAVLDTGVDSTHPDLSGNVLPGWNTVSETTESTDVFGHGTKVAGVIAALSDNDLGVTSIAWNASILPVRITNQSNGYAYYSDIAAGIIWAADNGADIANVSYGVTSSYTVTNAANYMRSKGGLVVVSAGNGGSDLDCQDNPSMITVSATDKNDAKTSWSDYGLCVDVAAPGAGIWTTKNGGGYGSASGTSFSAPATAAVLALIKAANPNLNIDEIENILKSSADNSMFDQEFSIKYGYGRVDAYAATNMANEVPDIDQEAPTVAITSPKEHSAQNGVFIVNASAQDNNAVAYVELFANGQSVGVDQQAPYEFSIDSTLYDNGELTLQADAFDSANNQASSSEHQLVIDNPTTIEDTTAPKLRLRKPVDGSTVKGRQRIVAKAKDDVELASVELFINGESVAKTSTKNRLAYRWKTGKINPGLYTITAIAVDTSGNKTTKSSTVTVVAR